MTASLSEDAIAHKCTCHEPLVHRVEEVSELLGMGLNQTYQAIARGEIPSLKIGRRILVPRQKLLDMLNGGTDAAK
jgi:excisionase family DNA binding protein